MPAATRTLLAIAEEVKILHEKDEALSKVRAKTKVEQRDIRLRTGELVNQVPDEHLAFVAQRSGYTTARLKDFAFVRKQWPNGTFPSDSNYTALEELARDPGRFDLITGGMSKRDARAAKGGKVDTPSRWSPEVKADFIREALDDPAVARKIANSQSARAAMAEAEWQMSRERKAQKEATVPGRKVARENTEKAELLRSLDNIAYAIGKAVGKAIDLGLGGDAEVAEVASEISTAATWLSEYAISGSTGFDDALRRLLEENS